MCTESEKTPYETSLKIMRDYNNTVRSAEDKGREEERLIIAKSMIEQGFDANMISKITGLSKEDLSKL